MTQINSTLYLCKNVPLDPNYNYTLDFDNLTAQSSFFDNLVDNTLLVENEDYSYIRDSQTIKVFKNIDDLLGVNYLFYNNGGKRYYAFITKKEYKSATCTEIVFKIDVLQSFMFDYSISESFVEREHQDRFTIENSDLKPIYNTKAENLEKGGEYKVISSTEIKETSSQYEPKYWAEMITTEPITSQSGTLESGTRSQTLKIDNVDTGLYVYLCPIGTIGGSISAKGFDDNYYQIHDNFLGTNLEFNKSTAVLSIRIIDYVPFNYTLTARSGGHNMEMYTSVCMAVIAGNTNFGGIDLSQSQYSTNRWLNLSQITSSALTRTIFGTITPITFNNNLSIENLKNIDLEPKLYTKEYRYRYITNGRVEPLNVYNEYVNETKNIKYLMDLGVNYKTKIYVDNYLGDNGKNYNAIDNGVNELPLLTSAYISYIAQNKANATSGVAINIGSKILATAGGIGIGLATGGLGLIAGLGVAGSNALGIGTQIGSELTKMQDLKDTPDNLRKAGNDATFDIVDKNYKLKIYDVSIADNYKETIFNYLYHYGYKCNDFKAPNVRSRYYFNYIKTLGCNIATNIDNDFRIEIATIFDRGITIWHYRNATTFKGVNNYNYENVETNLISEEE